MTQETRLLWVMQKTPWPTSTDATISHRSNLRKLNYLDFALYIEADGKAKVHSAYVMFVGGDKQRSLTRAELLHLPQADDSGSLFDQFTSEEPQRTPAVTLGLNYQDAIRMHEWLTHTMHSLESTHWTAQQYAEAAERIL